MTFYGVMITSENKIWMITELMDANLEKLNKFLTPTQQLKASIHIAKAMYVPKKILL